MVMTKSLSSQPPIMSQMSVHTVYQCPSNSAYIPQQYSAPSFSNSAPLQHHQPPPNVTIGKWDSYVTPSPTSTRNYWFHRPNEQQMDVLPESDFNPNGQTFKSALLQPMIASPSPPSCAFSTSSSVVFNPVQGWMKNPPQYGRVPGFRTGPGTNNIRVRTREKYRMVYSDHQRLELEKEFHYSPFVAVERKAQMSANLELTERQIKIWFQNRRAKQRRMEKKHPIKIESPPKDPCNNLSMTLTQLAS